MINKKNIIIFLIFCIGLIISYNSKKSFYKITAPLTYMTSLFDQLLYTVSSEIRQTTEKYIFLTTLHEKNLKLQNENQRLNNTTHVLIERVKQYQQREKSLHFKKKISSEILMTQVIGHDVLNNRFSLIVNHGAEDGVKPFMGVIHSHGVVGIIHKVFPKTSQVMLLLSSRIAVDVISQDTRIRGLITGTQGPLYDFKYSLVLSSEIIPFKKGELFVTNQLQNIFPKGIPVGHIHSIKRAQFKSEPAIKVTPTVNFNLLEEVMIIKKI